MNVNEVKVNGVASNELNRTMEETVPDIILDEVVRKCSQSQKSDQPDQSHEPEKNSKVSSLGIIALEYEDSESEVDDQNRKEDQTANLSTEIVDENTPQIEIEMYAYRQKNKSSSDESDSEDTGTSTDTSISNMSEESESSDNTNKNSKKRSTKPHKEKELKNEWDDLPPIEDLKISMPEVLCEPLGKVAWMVDQLVVVEPTPGKPTLNIDTVLFIDKGKRPLGQIFDVFGPVKEPYYCVRFNSAQHIEESSIKVGMTVYFCPNTKHTCLVFLHELMKCKGIDAVGDDEAPAFSDDEEERLYYEKLKQQQSNKKNESEIPNKRKCTSLVQQINNPWSRNAPFYARKANKNYSTHSGDQYHNPFQSANFWGSANIRQPIFGENNPYSGMYSAQLHPAQYANYYLPNPDQAFSNRQQNYEVDRDKPTTPSSSACHSTSWQGSSGFTPYPYPNLPSNTRFRYPGPHWRSQSPAAGSANTWVSLTPPPPPPPPTSDNN